MPLSKIFERVGAIVRIDTLFRFRRPASIITLLLISAGVYLIVPDYRNGDTLMQIDNQRVIYNSAAVALGTSMFCAMFLSAVGFYLVSNSFRRDIKSRTAYIIAATPVSNLEYILGKFFGNFIYLSTVMLACMFSSMGMYLLRGESGLQPLVFLETYLFLVGPSLVFVSAIALTFEAIPKLSGRGGDVLFFFVWAAVTAIPATALESKADNFFVNMVDVLGIIPSIKLLQEQFHTTMISIGSSTFDPAKPAILFPGIAWSGKVIFERVITIILPFALFMIALFSFHRFDPVKIKSSVKQSRRNILTRLTSMLKPINRFIEPIVMPSEMEGQKNTFTGMIRADLYNTLMLSPYITVCILIFGLLEIVMSGNALLKGLLPAVALVLVVILADIVPRDGSTRMMNLLMTTPTVKPMYVWWKFFSALTITFCFTLIPIIRFLLSAPSAAISLLIGSCFISAGAVAMGFLTRSTKLFVGSFMMLLYIALNAANEPIFDFFAFLGNATLWVQLGYATLTMLFIVVANARHRYISGAQ